jgi:shikimate kinase
MPAYRAAGAMRYTGAGEKCMTDPGNCCGDTENIILIGMPWSGKSTAGVLLAKQLSRNFVDTDLVIQAAEKRRLQEIIDTEGLAAFRRLEERHVLGLSCRGHVIATGGSVVYSESAMAHLKKNGCCIYLELPFAALKQRAADMAMRGLVRARGQSLRDLYEERTPLYARYADVTVRCGERNHEAVLRAIVAALSG